MEPTKLKEKDKVITAGGIHGQVVSLTDDEVILRIDARKDIQIKVTRGSVSTIKGSDAPDTAAADTQELQQKS